MNKRTKYIITGVISLVVVLVMVALIITSVIADPILTLYFGKVGGSEIDADKYSAYKNDEELMAARIKTGYDIEAEGAVLLKNDNAVLPLAKNSKVSVFGQHAHEILASGSGSGSIGDPEKNLKQVLEEKFSVNETLWNFYLNNGVKSLGAGPALAGGNPVTDWSVNECPQEKYTAEVKSTYNSFNDAAIVVISRTGGEGGDLAMDMSDYGGTASEHYLEITKEEKDLLSEVTSKFEKTIVLLNTNNPIELGFLDTYGIDACMYIGGVGMSGLNAIGDLLTGEVNPSGHLADTYVYDNFSAPAMQNFGDFGYSNNDNYKYVAYSEGIYVGYRYYETRYADVIEKAENAGDFNYDTTVKYPFGHGLSYSTFEWSDFTVDYDSTTDKFTASVTVKNNGPLPGKDVVEIYFQAPYTHGVTTVEKSAIELCGFAKTELLGVDEGNNTQTVTVEIPKNLLVSYDYKDAKTFILDAGKYYFTAADNAHQAVNNIMAKRGFEVDGKIELVDEYEQAEYDKTTYSKNYTQKESVTNLFDYAKYDGMKILSRENWSDVETGIRQSNVAISADALEWANKKGKDASRNPYANDSVTDIVVNSGGTKKLADFVETPYEDESWDELVKQIKKSDLQKLFATAGYQTMFIEEVGKNATSDSDGPGGIQSFVGGASAVKAYGYPTETVLACTWNVELAKALGEMVGEDGLHGNVNGWYAPGMDTHRSPFGGRNFEYYSEDGFIAGKLGASVVTGAQSKGLYCYIKHFALNEQDTNRGTTLHTYADEQAMREIYFEPFRISVQEGEALACMTSLTCIGPTAAVGNYDLITRLLKEEWGFKGIVLTDYLGYDADLVVQVLYAGGDGMLSTYGLFSDKSDATTAQLQRAAKSILYTVSRSSAMYADGVSDGFPVYKIVVIVVEIVLGLALVVANLLIFVILPRRKKISEQVR